MEAVPQTEIEALQARIAALEAELTKAHDDIKQQHHPTSRLPEGQELFRTVFEAATEGIWITDSGGFTTTVNPQMAEMLGYSPSEMIGRPYADFVHPEDMARARAGFVLRSDGDKSLREYRMRHRDGSTVWVTISATALTDPSGNISGIAAFFTDVTAFRQAEREKAEALGQLATVLESVTDGFIALDSSWRLTYVNAAAERISGRQRSEILGRNYWNVFPDTVSTIVEQEFRRAVRDQIVTEFESWFAPWEKWFRSRCYPLSDGGLSVFFRDVTEQKRAQQERRRLMTAVRESEERYRGMIEAAAEGVWTMDTVGMIKFANRRMVNLLEYPANEMIGRMYWEFLHPDDVARANDSFRRRKELHDLTPREFRFQTKSGGVLWMTVAGSPMYDATHDVTGVLVMCTDITERRKAQAELDRERERLKLALDAAKMGTWEWDIASDSVPWSHHLDPASGVSVVHQDDLPVVAEAVKESLETNVPFQIEYRTVQRDGSIRWVLSVGRAIRDAQDQPASLMGIAIDTTSRRQAEVHALRLADIIEATPDFVAIGRLSDGQLSYLNGAGRRMLGIPEDADISNFRHSQLCPTWVNQRTAIEWLPRALREGTASGEAALLALDGREIPVSLAFVVHRNAHGEVDSVSTIARDISQRKQTEAALKESQVRLQRTSDQFALAATAMRALIYDWDPALDHVVRVRGLEELTGYRNDEVPATAAWWTEQIHPEDRGLLDDTSPSAASEQIRIREYRFRNKHAHYIWIRDAAMLLHGDHGVNRVIGCSVDITEQKQAESAIRESEYRFRRVIERSIFGIVLSDIEGGILYANDEFLRMLGYTREEWEKVSPRCTDLTPPEWLSLDSNANEELRQNGVSARYEKQYFRKDGSRVSVLIGSILVERPNQTQKHTVAFVIDLTDIKQVQRKLERSNEELEQFAWAAAHDLREPLRTVGIYAELLQRELGQDLKERPLLFLSSIRDGAQRMECLVRDLLSYTSAVYVRDPAGLRSNVAAIVGQAVTNLATVITNSEAVILASTDLPKLAAHDSHVLQLLQNLLGNAIKYRHAERTPRIEIAAQEQDGWWLLSVEDNGQGIPAEYQDRIFGVFKRLHGREVEGTGIGLAICKRIVEHYGGRIWVESDGRSGSTFFFTLPALEH